MVIVYDLIGGSGKLEPTILEVQFASLQVILCHWSYLMFRLQVFADLIRDSWLSFLLFNMQSWFGSSVKPFVLIVISMSLGSIRYIWASSSSTWSLYAKCMLSLNKIYEIRSSPNSSLDCILCNELEHIGVWLITYDWHLYLEHLNIGVQHLYLRTLKYWSSNHIVQPIWVVLVGLVWTRPKPNKTCHLCLQILLRRALPHKFFQYVRPITKTWLTERVFQNFESP